MAPRNALSKPVTILITVVMLACGDLRLNSAIAVDVDQGVELSREYLDAADDPGADDQKLSQHLARYDDQWDEVVSQLQQREFPEVQPGLHFSEHFSDPDLARKRPDDLLYFNVPETYDPGDATGLIIFLHGGGRRTERDAPRWALDFPDPDEEGGSQMGDLLNATGMIAVGPSALWNPKSAYRWCLRATDDYLADVIAECKARFHIDPDRVLLFGHSMGGFGAYHHLQRQPDRFAGVLVNAGSWSLGYWPMIRGTPVCVVHGVHDAVKGERWHYTDIEYARFTKKLFTEQNLELTYLQHDGEHGLFPSRDDIATYLKSAPKLRRDPYSPRIALASPVGFDEAYCFPVKHNRWLTLDEAVEGNLEYDELVEETDGDDFDAWRLTHQRTRRPGSAIESHIRGNNTIDVTTQNVARFSLWLHPRMVDITRPVTVVV
ncbi:MAG: alpha/beta fold hydrolase, partial [Planctomycetota bacterium]|nr:alpha/beta fold hydrolase [Planctomycetota bacterium]